LDVSDPEEIFELSLYETYGSTMTAFFVDDYLYTAEHGTGIKVHELSNPIIPGLAAQLELDFTFYSYDITESKLYTLNGYNLDVIDITEPALPVLENSFEFGMDYCEISVEEPYIYMASFGSGISVFEIISPDSLEFIRSFSGSEFSFDVEVDGNTGYFS